MSSVSGWVLSDGSISDVLVLLDERLGARSGLEYMLREDKSVLDDSSCDVLVR